MDLLSSCPDVVTPQTFLFGRLVPFKEGLVALLHHFSDRELPSITMSGVAFCLQTWPFFPGSCVPHSLGPCFLANHLDYPLLTHSRIDSALAHVPQSQDTALVMRQELNKAYIFPFADCDIYFPVQSYPSLEYVQDIAVIYLVGQTGME